MAGARLCLAWDGVFAVAVAALACQGGTPWLAFPALLVVNLGLTWLLRRQRSRSLGLVIAACRHVPKAVQLLAVALAVTMLFALEKQVDVVPNAFGFVELVAPIVAAAILFDISGGLFAAALVTIFGFQVLAPPRFDFILDVTSFTLTLSAFATVSILSAVHYASATAPWARALQVREDWSRLERGCAQVGPRLASELSAVRGALGRLAIPALLVVLYAFFWSTFAWVSSGNGLHIDSLEAYAWGREFVLGYYKHPPFWAWVAGLWFAVLPRSEWSFWFLSELNAALGLAGAWAVMGRFCDRRTRLLGLLLLMLTPFYQFNAQRFNANTILLSLWPWTIYFFIRSLETSRFIPAVVCGLLAGCALLSKYVSLILVATCFVAALTHDARSRYFRSAAPYVSALVAALVFAPHVLWMVRNGFQPLFYLAEKIDLADRHISNSYFQFIGAHVLFFALPSLLLLVVRWRWGAQDRRTSIAVANGPSFLAVLAIAPFILTLVAGTLGHAALAVPFGVPIFALLPLCLILLFKVPTEPALRVVGATVAGLVVACAIASPFLPPTLVRWGGSGYQDPRSEVADEAMHLWAQSTHRPLRYVGGERPYALAVTFRSADTVSEFNDFNMSRSPWISPEKLREGGLLAICRSQDLVCLAKARIYMSGSSQVMERSVARAVPHGRAELFTIIVTPPAS